MDGAPGVGSLRVLPGRADPRLPPKVPKTPTDRAPSPSRGSQGTATISGTDGSSPAAARGKHQTARADPAEELRKFRAMTGRLRPEDADAEEQKEIEGKMRSPRGKGAVGGEGGAKGGGDPRGAIAAAQTKQGEKGSGSGTEEENAHFEVLPEEKEAVKVLHAALGLLNLGSGANEAKEAPKIVEQDSAGTLDAEIASLGGPEGREARE